MTALNDEKYRVYRATVALDARNDNEHAWVDTQLVAPVVSGSVNDRWRQLMREIAPTANQRNDGALEFLKDKGLFGPQLNDGQHDYYEGV
jgi:hypothetical protein